MTASQKELEALHNAVANKLKESIDSMEPGDKGLAALLNVARQFVKDNGIEAVPAKGSPTGGLVDKLKDYPFNPEEHGEGLH